MPSPTTKRVIIGAIVVGIIIIAILLAWLLWPRAPKPVATSTQQPTTTTTKTSPTTTTAVPAVPVSPSAATLTAEGKLFLERYASFSSEAGYANLKDVLPLMTDAFAAKTQVTINKAQPSGTFYGVSVRVVTVTVNSVDEKAGTATLTIGAQLQETKGTAAPTVRYQNAVLTFIKVGTDWKVDSVTWK